MPKMIKPNHRRIDVADEAVENYKAHGFVLAEGEAEPDAPAESGELSEAEIKAEIAAVKKQARKKGKDAGLDKAEIDADVEAAESRAKAELGVE